MASSFDHVWSLPQCGQRMARATTFGKDSKLSWSVFMPTGISWSVAGQRMRIAPIEKSPHRIGRAARHGLGEQTGRNVVGDALLAGRMGHRVGLREQQRLASRLAVGFEFAKSLQAAQDRWGQFRVGRYGSFPQPASNSLTILFGHDTCPAFA